MNEYSSYDYNDENESIGSYDYFEQIEKEQSLNPALFSDPFIEIDELKFKNQLLFDKISTISAPSQVYIDIPSNLDFSDSKNDDHYDKSLKYKKQQNKSSYRGTKMKKYNDKAQANRSCINHRYENHQKIQKHNDSIYFSDLHTMYDQPSSNTFSPSKHLSFKERYNRSLNPKRSKLPEKNLIKRATEMQEKLEKIKKENQRLNHNYRSMLYKVEKTKEDVRILQDALDTSQFERLVLGHYDWSVYAEKSF